MPRREARDTGCGQLKPEEQEPEEGLSLPVCHVARGWHPWELDALSHTAAGLRASGVSRQGKEVQLGRRTCGKEGAEACHAM